MISAANVKEQSQLVPYAMTVITKMAPHVKCVPIIASFANQEILVSNVLTVFTNQVVNVKSVTKVVQLALMEQMPAPNAQLVIIRTTYYDALNVHKTVMNALQNITAQTVHLSSF